MQIIIKKRSLTVVRYILFSIVLYMVGKTLFEQMGQFNLSNFDIGIPYVIASASCEILARLFISAGYWLLLKFSDTPLSFQTIIGVSWSSFLGKYLPGKIAIMANAIFLLKQYRIPTLVAGTVPFLSTVMTIFVALFLSLPLLFSENGQILFNSLHIIIILPFIIMGTIFSIKPRSFISILNKLLRKLGIPMVPFTFSNGQISSLIGTTCLQCIFAGISTWFICQSVCSMNLAILPQIIFVTAFSGVMGLLAFFSPAGIGVRDGFYFLILGSITGPENAVIITILLRLIQTVMDLGTAGIGAIILYFDRPERMRQ